MTSKILPWTTLEYLNSAYYEVSSIEFENNLLGAGSFVGTSCLYLALKLIKFSEAIALLFISPAW